MIKEAKDFNQECDTLAGILDELSEVDFQQATLFENWTIEDVIGHLYLWNYAAAITLESREKFTAFHAFAMKHFDKDGSSLPVQYAWFDEYQNGIRGKDIYKSWRDFYPILADQYHQADTDTRVAWAGPDMSVRSKIIARQMETWSHGQEVFDLLGLEREDKDRIRNIAHLGVTTYSWTFKVRGEAPPQPKPFVQLTAPSGAIWEWNDEQDNNVIRGSATQFCQIVTQTRNIDDTALETTGSNAREWMEKAQCFAGMPKAPPPKGLRHKSKD